MSEKSADTNSELKQSASSGAEQSKLKALLRKLLASLMTALGLGKKKHGGPGAAPTDTNTVLAHERTDLAMERTYWAADRTLMAWVRTALSMISFGFTIGKLSQALQDVEMKTMLGAHSFSIQSIAYLLVVLGSLSLLLAAIQYNRRVHALRKQGLPLQVSLTFPVAVVLSVVGMLAFTALVLKM